ncbi:MAG: branched-chain amino acid aminotransferase [Muribaculaceae bacterium]|nr:branched-chain amino acid aminotransferase [Bacteroidales bacterium]MDY4811035.1 branched-chain amino acid aminotransferase [Muribaculaceae bacterium]
MKNSEIDWSTLGFGYVPTDYNVRCYYRDGKWGEIEISSSETIEMHIAATALHYGQEIFEGLKAFRGKDGKVRIFRPEENARRIRESARGIKMAEIPEELFIKMVKLVIKLNERFIPPYGSGASLYIRPLEIGMTAQVGVKPAKEYCFIILVSPVGPYFKAGFKPTNICIMRDYDRVAPKGTGRWKVGGNYAASLSAGEHAHELGYSAVLYLDPKEKKYLDECGPANFYAIKGNTYITPASDSILPSITNMSLMDLARDFGMTVEQRHIPVEEIPTFDEAAACGTAAVCSPVGEIHDLDSGEKFVIAKDGKPGPVTTRFYNTLSAIRLGEIEDTHGWNMILDL